MQKPSSISMANNQEDALYVALGATIDYFRFPDLSSGSQLEELTKNKKNSYVEVSSLKEASAKVSAYINANNLGASNWLGGKVLNAKGEFVAFVSYNGRVWDAEYSPTSQRKEILV